MNDSCYLMYTFICINYHTCKLHCTNYQKYISKKKKNKAYNFKGKREQNCCIVRFPTDFQL